MIARLTLIAVLIGAPGAAIEPAPKEPVPLCAECEDPNPRPEPVEDPCEVEPKSCEPVTQPATDPEGASPPEEPAEPDDPGEPRAPARVEGDPPPPAEAAPLEEDQPASTSTTGRGDPAPVADTEPDGSPAPVAPADGDDPTPAGADGAPPVSTTVPADGGPSAVVSTSPDIGLPFVDDAADDIADVVEQQPSEELLGEAEGLVLREIGVLTALDAFAAPTTWFSTISTELGYDELDRPQLLGELALVERNGALILDELDRRELTVTPEVRAQLGPLDPVVLADLAAGEPTELAAEPHTRALVSVLGRTETNLAATAGLADVEVASLLDELLDARLQELAAEREQERRSSFLMIAVLLVLLVIAVLVVVWSLRRRDDDAQTAAGLLAASRRMTGTLDAEAIRAIAGEEATRLTGAAAEVHPVAQVPATYDAIVRAAVEGRAPVSANAPHGSPMIAAPIEVDGSMTDVVLVLGERGGSISDEQRHVVDQLTPLIASALTAASSHQSVSELALIDELTGLANRRALEPDLAAARAPSCVVMVDVDHFKRFNDTHGHAAGDRALRVVASIMESSVRPADRVYRYGGEEFCILLRDIDAGTAAPILDRLRQAIEAGTSSDGSLPSAVTVSLGLAARQTPESADRWLERADAALYEAKRRGRNRLVTVR